MREFNIGDVVFQEVGICKDLFGEVVDWKDSRNGDFQYEVFFPEIGSNIIVSESSLTGIDRSGLENILPDHMTEMATILADSDKQYRIQVNPDPNRAGVPYFKVFDTFSPKKNKSHVARLHFLDDGMEYHNGDGYLDLVITRRNIKEIQKLLNEKNDNMPDYTNWNVACFMWNTEFRLISSNIKKYMNGDFDNINHPSYVPSTTEMPKTWIYNPPKNKNKRKLVN